MGTSITEKILGNNNLYTDKYLKDCINLTKSILLVNSKEASLYNENISINYPSFTVDLTDKKTWRYYKHLTAQYHPLDKPITIISLDNGESITLNSSTIELHKITRKELLKFDLFYKETVDKYPEQELYIKALINRSNKYTVQEIIDSEDFTIISYNSDLIEENEDDILYTLQERINNYKVSNLISYYSIVESLFIASQYHILYNFILTSIIGIRLKNAKTLRAHSYHILNYLSSHHYLDRHFNYLTKKQSLFLYRNLLYLDNHSGQDKTFRTLIEKLFTERNISVVNYTYSQSNSLDDSYRMNYKFKQKLLNNSNLVYSYKDYSLAELKDKEIDLAKSNIKDLTYNYDKIDNTLKNSLFNTLLTKDLETIVVDNTDTVKYKLIPTIIDYWAYLLSINKMKFLVSVLDPVSNKELKLSTKDLFKLFTVVLYKLNNLELSNFPIYTVQRVYKNIIPETEELLKGFYRKKHYYADIIDTIRHHAPSYTNTITSFQFEQFVSSVYRLNIGLWLYLSNTHDKDDNGQLEMVVSRLHRSAVYSFNDETVTDYLKRIGIENIYTYSPQALEVLSYSILNNLFDNKLAFLNKYKYIQKSLIEIFKKFNSYSVQIIDNYTSQSPILAGPKDVRFTMFEDAHYRSLVYEAYLLNVDMDYRIRYNYKASHKLEVKDACSYSSDLSVNLKTLSNLSYQNVSRVSVNLSHKVINSTSIDNWIVNASSDEDLKFLALNT